MVSLWINISLLTIILFGLALLRCRSNKNIMTWVRSPENHIRSADSKLFMLIQISIMSFIPVFNLGLLIVYTYVILISEDELIKMFKNSFKK